MLPLHRVYVPFMGFTLTDPATFLTDIVMAAICFWCGHRLYRDFKNEYSRWHGLFFFFLGLSMLNGGTAHLLFYYFGHLPHYIAWTIQGFSILIVEWASTTLMPKGKAQKSLRIFAVLFYVVYLVFLWWLEIFTLVKINSTIGLIGFSLPLHAYYARKTGDKVFWLVPISVLLFLIPALTHATNIHFNDWINRNVVSHILLSPCFLILYLQMRKVSNWTEGKDEAVEGKPVSVAS